MKATDYLKILIVLFILCGLVVLFFQAKSGDSLSIAILSVLASLFLILIGVGITLLAIIIMEKREQSAFMRNAKENLQIMQQMQRLQNTQHQLFQKQAFKLSEPDNGRIVFDEGVFDELDE